MLQCVRFEDGEFNRALAVAQISANNVTLNSKSTQNVPIQYCTHFFYSFSFQAGVFHGF